MTRAPRPGQESTAAEALLTVYDAWNRPAKVYKDTNTNGTLDVGTDALVAEYRYDGRNYRITKLLPNASNWDRTDYYYNEGWKCLEERTAANQEDKDTVAASARYQYVWDIRYIDAPVLRWRDINGDDTDALCGKKIAAGAESSAPERGAKKGVTTQLFAAGLADPSRPQRASHATGRKRGESSATADLRPDPPRSKGRFLAQKTRHARQVRRPAAQSGVVVLPNALLDSAEFSCRQPTLAASAM